MAAPEAWTCRDPCSKRSLHLTTYAFKLWEETVYKHMAVCTYHLRGLLTWTVKAIRKLPSKFHFAAAAQIMTRKRAVCGFAALPNILFRGCLKVKTVKVFIFLKQSMILLSIYWILTDLSKCLWWYLRLKCQLFEDYFDRGIIKHSSRKFPLCVAGNNEKYLDKVNQFCFHIMLSKD